MKFTNRRIANTIIISTLLVASIASIGFSSWLIGGSNSDNEVNIDTSIGSVGENITINDGAFYIFNSQYAFSYYVFTDGTSYEYVSTNSRLGFKIKISPSLIEEQISNISRPSSLYIYTEIKYETPNNFDMFTSLASNTNTRPPKYMKYCLSSNDQYYFYSEQVTSSYVINDGVYSCSIQSKTLLYKLNEVTLLEFVKNFASSSGYVYLDVFYDFELLQSFDFEMYKTLNLSFGVSLYEARS